LCGKAEKGETFSGSKARRAKSNAATRVLDADERKKDKREANLRLLNEAKAIEALHLLGARAKHIDGE